MMGNDINSARITKSFILIDFPITFEAMKFVSLLRKLDLKC